MVKQYSNAHLLYSNEQLVVIIKSLIIHEKSAQIIRKSKLTANLPTVLNIDKLMMINLFTESEGHQLN